jgi:hypothetical protein
VSEPVLSKHDRMIQKAQENSPSDWYVGIDISERCTAVCVRHLRETIEITYACKGDVDQYIVPDIRHDRIIHLTKNSYKGDLEYRGYKEMILSAIGCTQEYPKRNIQIAYEAPLRSGPETYEDQRTFAEGLVDELKVTLPTAVFVSLNNLQVKWTWAKRFGTEPTMSIPMDRLYGDVQQYIKKNRTRRSKVRERSDAKRAVKLTNYIIWQGRQLPGLLRVPLTDSVEIEESIPLTSGHPVSDIVDCYMLARHLYFTDNYSAGYVSDGGVHL